MQNRNKECLNSQINRAYEGFIENVINLKIKLIHEQTSIWFSKCVTIIKVK